MILDQDKRARLLKAKAEVRELLRPERERQKIARAKARKATKAARAERPMLGQRQPRQHEPDYLRWIRGLPCVACMVQGALRAATRCEAAHVRAGYPEDGWRPTGMAEKPDDRRTLPLCAGHHREGPKAQHAANERAWWAALGIHPPALCAALADAYDNNLDGANVIAAFKEKRRC